MSFIYAENTYEKVIDYVSDWRNLCK
jgi:hypothetical protein